MFELSACRNYNPASAWFLLRMVIMQVNKSGVMDNACVRNASLLPVMGYYGIIVLSGSVRASSCCQECST